MLTFVVAFAILNSSVAAAQDVGSDTGSILPQDEIENEVIASSDLSSTESEILQVTAGSEQTATLYEPTTGAKIWEIGLPFDSAIARVSIASVSPSTFAVGGVGCGEVVRNHGWGQECQPGGLALALIDVETREWTELSIADVASGDSYVDVLGSYDDDVIVEVDDSIVSVPIDGSEVGSAPAVPLEGFDEACLSEGLVAVVLEKHHAGNRHSEPGDIQEISSEPFIAYESAILDLDAMEWQETGGPDQLYSEGLGFVSRCAGSHVLAVPGRPIETPRVDVYRTHRLNIQAGVWDEIDPPPTEFISPGASTWTGDEFVLPVTTVDGNTQLGVDAAGVWTMRAGGSGGDVRSITAAGDRFATLGHSETIEPPAVSAHDGVLPTQRSASEDLSQPPAADSSAAVETLATGDWNICGGLCHGGGPSGGHEAIYSRNVAGLRNFMLQEVCAGQLWTMASSWAQAGVDFDHVYYVARSNAGSCNGDDFGNVVFIFNGNITRRFTYIYDDSNQEPGNPERRGAACINSNYVEPFVSYGLFCSTHLINDDRSIAERQSGELNSLMNTMQDERTFQAIGGDFNLAPFNESCSGVQQWFLSWYTDGFREFDVGYSNDPLNGCPVRSTHSNGKIDHLFIRSELGNEFFVDAHIGGTGSSDHNFIYSTNMVYAGLARTEWDD